MIYEKNWNSSANEGSFLKEKKVDVEQNRLHCRGPDNLNSAYIV
jgi:hypothetical protein